METFMQFDRGYWKDEANGKEFDGVFILSVEVGWLYELTGRWLDENDPRVIAAKIEAGAQGNRSIPDLTETASTWRRR